MAEDWLNMWLSNVLKWLLSGAFPILLEDPADDKSTLVQVIAWCRQATSHYLNQCWLKPITWTNVDYGPLPELMLTKAHCLNQCWLRPIAHYDVIRPQWTKYIHLALIIAVNIRYLSCSAFLLWCLTNYLGLVQQGHCRHYPKNWCASSSPTWANIQETNINDVA